MKGPIKGATGENKSPLCCFAKMPALLPVCVAFACFAKLLLPVLFCENGDGNRDQRHREQQNVVAPTGYQSNHDQSPIDY
jgi:hypothetical protein